MNAKMSALFLLAIMALGGTGFAGAWWTAQLKITGTVTTGTFGMEWSLDGYKISGDKKGIITGKGVYLTDYVTDTVHPQTLAIDLEHVYPSTDLEFLADLYYYGNVPGHIKDFTKDIKVNGVLLADLPDWMFCEVYINDIDSNLLTQRPTLTVGSFWLLSDFMKELVSTQWHYGYYIDFFVYIHWIETGMTFTDPWGQTWTVAAPGIEVPQDATLTFTLTADVVQYNAP